ncbi:AfsR/SARP family transcriptional regulator [Actinacidiphila bryophytorum]|uniref:Transposase n=1 Tax=Actinacidiphila bryophytorum TaxID=1436133 RepID=A0A9W4H6R8_9ACTN|nr:BTAD domain-containing putative transcriptional regulator [Actinacidiphila bryophytorum]MBM9436862.1 transcriptional regulator [Actinacidiphila bryophytorum]MBN6545815.1 transcriptional regulator [Actinacidiphila bryophytorum]CAG7654583.1 transposase [Actinacidiphila bryophytorum]
MSGRAGPVGQTGRAGKADRTGQAGGAGQAAQAGSSAQVTLRLLGDFELRCGDTAVPVAAGSRRLMAFVALHHHPVSRCMTGAALWPDAAAERAAASLRTALWRLPEPAGRPLVSAAGTQLSLDAAILVDLHQGSARAGELLEPDGAAATGPPTVPAVLRGDLLPGWDEEWLLPERERFRQLRLHALERLCERLTAEGRYGHALEAGLAAVDIEPLRESAHRAVLRVHLREGNAVEALRTYRAYGRLLAAELDLRPSVAIRRLIEPVLAARADSHVPPQVPPAAAHVPAQAAGPPGSLAGLRPLDVPGGRLPDRRLQDAWAQFVEGH